MTENLTPEEREEAKQLGHSLVELLSSKSPLIAGYALAAVLKCMPPTVKEALDFARERIIKALEWQRKQH